MKSSYKNSILHEQFMPRNLRTFYASSNHAYLYIYSETQMFMQANVMTPNFSPKNDNHLFQLLSDLSLLVKTLVCVLNLIHSYLICQVSRHQYTGYTWIFCFIYIFGLVYFLLNACQSIQNCMSQDKCVCMRNVFA